MMSPYQKLLALTEGYKSVSCLIAACDLDLFTWLIQHKTPATAAELANGLTLNERAVTSLLRALTSMKILEEKNAAYQVLPEYLELLNSRSEETVVPAVRHWGTCMRQWSQLAWTVKTGSPPPKQASIQGPLADYQSFIWAMNSIGSRLSHTLAEKMHSLGLLNFSRMLDIGGASGTYTKAFLSLNSQAYATIFDLPLAIREAQLGLENSPLQKRIQLVAGDFYTDELPAKNDFIWISAIIHQHGLAQTLDLFQKAYRAMIPGGKVAIRDVFFHSDRLGPECAVFFDLNMLSATTSGRVYTEVEVFELLREAGFQNPKLVIPSEEMSAVIVAVK